MISLYWVEGTIDGAHVAGFQLATSGAEAKRLARHFAGAKRGRGRPRKGQTTVQITAVERAS